MAPLKGGASYRRLASQAGLMAIVLLSVVRPAPAETSPHERSSVRGSPGASMILAADASLVPLPSGKGLAAAGRLGVELLSGSRLGVSLGLPVALAAQHGGASGRAIVAVAGNLEMRVSLAAQREAWRLDAGLSGSFPFWRCEADIREELDLVTPPGQLGISLHTGLARCLDPLILGAELDLDTTWPVYPEDCREYHPLGLAFDLSMLELLSPSVCLVYSLGQKIEGPSMIDGATMSRTWTYSIEVSFGLYLALRNGSARIGFSGPKSPVVRTGLSLGRGISGDK